jgi:hypothetical protein
MKASAEFGGKGETLRWIGELLSVHVFVEVVTLVARENVQMIMECMLASCGFVVLEKRDTLTVICLFHDDRYFFGYGKNVST